MKEHATRLGKLIRDDCSCLSKIGDARAINPRHQLAGIKVADPLYLYAILEPSIVSNNITQVFGPTISDNGPSELLPC